MLKINIGSNFLGTAYLTLLQFALLPIILNGIGSEAYGLIGVFILLVTVFSLFDLGMSPALGRELAKLSAETNTHGKMRLTVSTLEIVAFGISVVIASTLYFAAKPLAAYWLNNTVLDKQVVANCLQWMALQAGLQFMTSFYNSGLQGLQSIVLFNLIQVLNQSLRAVAVVALMYFHAPVSEISLVEQFFILNVISAVIGLGMTSYFLYRRLSTFEPRVQLKRSFSALQQRFSVERLHACWRYAAGMTATTVVVMVLTQLDKLILSKLLSLEAFGIYTIAATVAMAVTKPAPLVFSAILPRFTQQLTSGNLHALKETYRKSIRLIAWLILPLSGLIIVFSEPIFHLYLGQQSDYREISELSAVLILGNALHSLTYMPYAISLAYGWTRYGFNISVVASFFLVPLILIGAIKYGPLGAAYAWLLLNIGYLIFSIRYLHRKVLPEMYSVFYKEIGMPAFLLLICLGFYLSDAHKNLSLGG